MGMSGNYGGMMGGGAKRLVRPSRKSNTLSDLSGGARQTGMGLPTPPKPKRPPVPKPLSAPMPLAPKEMTRPSDRPLAQGAKSLKIKTGMTGVPKMPKMPSLTPRQGKPASARRTKPK